MYYSLAECRDESLFSGSIFGTGGSADILCLLRQCNFDWSCGLWRWLPVALLDGLRLIWERYGMLICEYDYAIIFTVAELLKMLCWQVVMYAEF